MARLNTVRSGDQGEYVAAHLLSQICSVVPVPRQEDHGVDFHCAILEKDGSLLLQGESFDVQIKRLDAGSVVIDAGGSPKKRYQVVWHLGGRPNPFLLGLVNRAQSALELYSTSNLWEVRWDGIPLRLQLVPGGKREVTFEGPQGARSCARVALGAPVVRLAYRVQENAVALPGPDELEQARNALRAWTRLDDWNRVMARWNVPVCFDFESWEANSQPSDLKHQTFMNPKGYTIPATERVLTVVASALAANYSIADAPLDKQAALARFLDALGVRSDGLYRG